MVNHIHLSKIKKLVHCFCRRNKLKLISMSFEKSYKEKTKDEFTNEEYYMIVPMICNIVVDGDNDDQFYKKYWRFDNKMTKKYNISISIK